MTSREKWLWIIAIALFGIGDTILTLYAVNNGIFDEWNPFIAPVFAVTSPYISLPILKLIDIAIGWFMWIKISKQNRIGVPIGFIVVGLVTTVWNTWIIST